MIPLWRSPLMRSLVREYKSKAVPGVGRRMKIIKEDTPNLETVQIDDELLESMDTDFKHAHKMYDGHKRDNLKLKNIIHYKRIERHHFEVAKQPNMLLWSEKEQIRHLHQKDPDIWTPEKLSQGFPATPDIIKKILKATWVPKDLKKIKKHDEKVIANWESLKKGALDVKNTILLEHLKKFSSRDSARPYDSYSSLQILHKPPPKPPGEFASLVAKKEEVVERIPASTENQEIEGAFISQNHRHSKRWTSRRLITLDQLKEELGKKGDLSSSPMDKLIVESKDHGGTGLIEPNELVEEDFQATPKPNAVQFPEYPTQITIPESQYVQGATYRVKDCYYDDDGEFLYRVPGMSSLYKKS